MTLRQREPRHRDDAHLAFVRDQPCVFRGCPRRSEAAHLRIKCEARGKRETGMQEKPGDQWTTPLCAYHHREGIDSQHKIGDERLFWELRGIDPFALALTLWEKSGGAARAQEPKPAKRPRKIKARNREAPKQKIQSRPTWPVGRKLQSRNTFERRP